MKQLELFAHTGFQFNSFMKQASLCLFVVVVAILESVSCSDADVRRVKVAETAARLNGANTTNNAINGLESPKKGKNGVSNEAAAQGTFHACILFSVLLCSVYACLFTGWRALCCC